VFRCPIDGGRSLSRSGASPASASSHAASVSSLPPAG
jgi:hypothetical protein